MATQRFRDWLMAHEGDIALGINDFDDLREEFSQVIGREAVVAFAEETEPAPDAPAADESA